MKLYGELFEDSREALLNALADAIDGYDRSRSKCADPAPDSAADEPQQGDFLYDFTRLNLQYLNHMARLGSNYSIVAGRVLERLYDQFIPKSAPEEPAPTRLSGVEGECKRVRMTITNSGSEKASFGISPFPPLGPDRLELRFNGAPIDPPLELLRARSLTVDMLVKFPLELAPGKEESFDIQLTDAPADGSVKSNINRIVVCRVAE